MDNILEIKDLRIEFHTFNGVVKAINGLNLTIPRGKTVGLVGETGAGKTTTALAIMGLVPTPPGVITSGEVIFEGKSIYEMKENELRSMRGGKIAMIFQNPMTSLNPAYTVGEQIRRAIMQHDNEISREHAWKKAGDMLELVGIPQERLNNYPHEFSGGMKQRVCIAIGLVCNPSLLIADEPTTALDVTIQAQILDLMKGIKEKFNTSTIFITHALGVVNEIADYVAVMYAGNIIENGDLKRIFTNPLHPYTQGLFGCLPDIDSEESKPLFVIKGSMPDPLNMPKGCKFCPRCKHAMDICFEQEPEELMVDEEHMVKCHLYASKEEK